MQGQRWATWFLLPEGTSAAEIHRRLESVSGPHAPSRPTLYNSAEAFKDGKASTEDGACSGRPRTAGTKKTSNRYEL